jgi:hypothetical protein
VKAAVVWLNLPMGEIGLLLNPSEYSLFCVFRIYLTSGFMRIACTLEFGASVFMCLIEFRACILAILLPDFEPEILVRSEVPLADCSCWS